MYYILNETDQIIAADNHLLGLCSVNNINELSSILAVGEIKFDLSATSLSIHIDKSDKMFSISKTSLSSMLGHLTLVELASEEENDLAELPISEFSIDDITEDLTPLDLDSDLISILSDSDKDTVQDEISEEIALLLTDDDFIGIKEENIEVPETAEAFDLDLSTQDDLFGAAADTDDTIAIPIDIETISQQIGISQEDYNLFLDEYIDAAIDLEEDLQSDEAEKRSNAIETLSHLGEVLRLPVIGEIIANIASASTETQKTMIASFYGTLSRLTTQTSPHEEVPQEEAPMEPMDTVTLTEEPEPVVNENSFGTIDLYDVKPIHFDFQLEEAANDLSLPVELIEEFVNDFIDQGHLETKKMLEAYEKGDLKTIQEIGHLLKGTSSNLRINALSDTLYKIQFCEDSSNLETLIKDYWGHFLSFEIQINAISRQKEI
ncbi:MAG: hypothetical protein COB07_01190 [Sulfurovum sp.]|nr:MAG: hypothetical protein COB07_01190 [Sulfurovum sp.]